MNGSKFLASCVSVVKGYLETGENWRGIHWSKERGSTHFLANSSVAKTCSGASAKYQLVTDKVWEVCSSKLGKLKFSKIESLELIRCAGCPNSKSVHPNVMQNEKGSDDSGEVKAFKSHHRHLMASNSTVLSNDGSWVRCNWDWFAWLSHICCKWLQMVTNGYNHP